MSASGQSRMFGLDGVEESMLRVVQRWSRTNLKYKSRKGRKESRDLIVAKSMMEEKSARGKSGLVLYLI